MDMQSTAHPEEKRPNKRHRRHVVFPGMIDSTELQRQIVQEVLQLHHQSTRNNHNNSATAPGPIHYDDHDHDNGNGSSEDKNYCPLEPLVAKTHADSCFCKTSNFWQDLQTLQTSRKLELGLSSCGGDVTKQLPIATSIARRAFAKAAQEAEQNSGGDFLYCNGDNSNNNDKTRLHSLKLLQTMGQQPEINDVTSTSTTATSSTTPPPPLTGLSLLYGPLASMSAHYDSPTQPGQREEWLVMISIGSSIIFRCNDECIQLDSGDVIVMDSMSTLHGVERMVGNNNINHYTELGLQTPCRLGLLFWQGRPATNEEAAITLPSQDEENKRGESLLDGVGDLFADDDE